MSHLITHTWNIRKNTHSRPQKHKTTCMHTHAHTHKTNMHVQTNRTKTHTQNKHTERQNTYTKQAHREDKYIQNKCACTHTKRTKPHIHTKQKQSCKNAHSRTHKYICTQKKTHGFPQTTHTQKTNMHTKTNTCTCKQTYKNSKKAQVCTQTDTHTLLCF
jgi:hypothetical protein